MKIGIITLVGNNYGNRLQNYAVQELLTEYGDVYTVRHEKKSPAIVRQKRISRYSPTHIIIAVNSRLLNIYHLGNHKWSFLKRTLYFINHKNEIKTAMLKRDEEFRKFDERYIHFESDKLHLSGDVNEPWLKSYDAWVCGSDQIWNPTYPTATRNAFLQFAPEQRRIALSASIGLSDTKSMLPQYPEWISSIPYLSVREDRAAEIVRELTGRKAEVFLDPTMLISMEKWDQIADTAQTQLPNKFAVGYFLGIREKKYLDYIEKQTEGMEYVDLLNGEAPEYMSFGPDQVVDAIRKAEIVFVDSFHGAVFSILFHKQFVVFERIEEGQTMNSRLQTLLKRFGLENRIYNGYNSNELKEIIDYNEVDKIIAKEKIRVREFLNKAMKEISRLPMETANEIKHIQISRPEKCCGCTACSQVCPKNCINMQEDAEGFVYPVVDEKICIECGKCKAVCPVRN
ncbi:MAG: polysaccharide pyruvyl transferase family protein, partial [Alphaproteobacteria bacterium]|nr:polysaccharide pyruvyl transferase family protein [Alphaproteobacteria bacterium]